MSSTSRGATLRLRDGREMPAVGYGLYQIPPHEATAATMLAIELGYRHLDSASFYANEAEVGAGIKASGVPRDQLFVATKVWTDVIGLGPEAVKASVRESLRRLGLSYVDCCYVHWPCPGHVDAYRALEDLVVSEGTVRSIGLSNYRREDFEALSSLRVAPVVNQIEINPFMYRRETIGYFESRGIKLVAYKPLLRGAGLDKDPKVSELAAARGFSPAQLLLKWGLDKGFAVIPKSTNRDRMRQNLAVVDTMETTKLDDETTAYLDSLTASEAAVADTFQAHFAKRAVVDPAGPTLAVYGPDATAEEDREAS